MSRSLFPFELKPRPERGGCLTALVAVAMVFYFLAGASILLGLTWRREEVEVPAEVVPFLPYMAAFSLLAAIGMWGIWRWKRWGMYLFAGVVLLTLVIDVGKTHGPLGSPIHVVVLALVLLLIRRCWEFFE